MEGKERQYDGILKRFGFVLSQCRLYSEKHPSAQLAARGFLAMLESVLESEATLTLGFVGERLLVNGHLVDDLTKLTLRLEESDGIKNRLLSVISHELRTPISIILGNVDLLMEGTFGDLNDKQKNSLLTVLLLIIQIPKGTSELDDLRPCRTIVYNRDVL